MDLGISGKVALVGGGSRGIGRAVAKELVREGVHVMIAARSSESVQEGIEVCREVGQEVDGIDADMTASGGVEKALAATRERFGSPDILITNAYPGDAPHRMGIDNVTQDALATSYQNLVAGPVHAIQAVIPHMQSRGWGRIVNIGSAIVRELHAPPTTMILSNINRLGAVGLMKSLAFDLGKEGITVNMVGTGAIKTDRSESYFHEIGTNTSDVEAGMASAEFPLGVPRLGTPREMAAVVVFLCSTQASYVSGEVLNVTGGKTLSPGL